MICRTAALLLAGLVGVGLSGCGAPATTPPDIAAPDTAAPDVAVPDGERPAAQPAPSADVGSSYGPGYGRSYGPTRGEGAVADGPSVRFRAFRDPSDGLSGIDGYRRVPAATNATFEQIKKQPGYTMPLVIATPEKPRGSPRIALLDFDGDGDLDIDVTNGPGAANGLHANRLEETGTLRFEDVAEAAGGTDQDSTGVGFGDLDDDGDPDLVVLGRSEPNRLFENRGDGTFRDATAASALGGSDLGHTDCPVGDVDGDGLLDLAVANSYDSSRRRTALPRGLPRVRDNCRGEAAGAGPPRPEPRRPSAGERAAGIRGRLGQVDVGFGDPAKRKANRSLPAREVCLESRADSTKGATVAHPPWAA